MKENESQMNRRSAIKWMMSATATVHLLEGKTLGQDAPSAKGYGTDPNLLTGEIPWDRILSDDQLNTTAVLADLILPRTNNRSPSASDVKVHEFIDEWISAPYPDQQADRQIIEAGLRWLDDESRRRFNRSFDELNLNEQTNIADDINYVPDVKAPFQAAARFFSKFRNLTLGGYYTTNVGMRDVGYVGNMPQTRFDGPPPEVLERLEIEERPW